MQATKNSIRPLLRSAVAALASLFALTAHAAAPGVTGTTATGIDSAFDLVASEGYISQPDGNTIYSWGYGCNTPPGGFLPTTIPNASCSTMQIPAPTLIVHQNDVVRVTLHNNLPAAAGNTSILFPGFAVATTGGAPGLLTREAINGGDVTYTFTATTAGTHAYYSGTQGDLQIEMGLYGVIIVLPDLNGGVPTAYASPAAGSNLPDTCHALGDAVLPAGHDDFRLAAAAYDHPSACYDREYLFQFSEIDPSIHRQAEEQRARECPSTTTPGSGCMVVVTEPYVPAYFMINGRSMPDDMDPNYSIQYPHQPYNGNPHMHPGELVLLRIVGTGRWQHPFHEHGNHVRILGRDGNLLLGANNALAGPALFTTTTTPGEAMDGIFYWTGKGLNWDVYAHTANGTNAALGQANCVADANGYYSTAVGASPDDPNYYEWCADHLHALESHPFSNLVPAGGPVTLPDPNILAGGPWYGGSPYLGPDPTTRAVGSTPIPPSGTVANSPTDEAGFSFMWHSHNEREITTNNAFPGGMMMMMLVDPWVYEINEAN